MYGWIPRQALLFEIDENTLDVKSSSFGWLKLVVKVCEFVGVKIGKPRALEVISFPKLGHPRARES